jgi:hypothetical protein
MFMSMRSEQDQSAESWHGIFGSHAAVHLCQFVPTTPLKYSKLCQSGKKAQSGIVLNVAKLRKRRNLYP